MKKIIKLSKIVLLIAMVFSYISSPISVLAEEIATSGLKPLVIDFVSDDNGEEYTLTYISANPSDYEDTKNYKIELETTITYTNGNEDTKQKEITVLGADLNSNTGGSSNISEFIDKVYSADYVIEVSVYDDTNELLFNEQLEYETNYSAGLTGKLNEVTTGELLPVSEVVGETTVGNYNVTEGVYTQKMSILPGKLSPLAEYRVVYNNDDIITYSEVMTANELALLVFDGTSTDLTDKLAGEYSYVDSVTIEEVSGDEVDGYKVESAYTYDYNATLSYGTDNDELFSNLYEITFEDGYMIVNAKDLYETESVITIGEVLDTLSNTTITLEVLDEEGNIFDLNDEEVLISEVKNNYVLRFTNGATASYEVVVMGDTNYDNEFTNEDLVGVINGYIDEEDMLSMDMWSSNESNIPEEFGTITFEDVIITNELFKEEINLDREEVDNESLVLEFEDLSSEVYVGDIVELQVLLSKTELEEITNVENEELLDLETIVTDEENTDIEDEEEVVEFIDGIDASIKLSDNIKIKEVKFNEVLTGSYNEEGRVVAVGDMLTENIVVMTLVLEVISLGEGNASVELSGSTSKFLNIDEFETITTEFNVVRKLSTNNNLASLSASVGTFDLDFDKDITVYTLTVPYNTESVILSGSLEDLYSDVDGLIEYELIEDKTTAIITVTAEDGSTKVYTVYIIKESAPVVAPIVYYYSSNNYLKSLEIDGYEIEFDKYIQEYKINVKNGVESLDIKALAEHYAARVEITGNSNFKEGENIVTITVTAENGSVREYKLLVNMVEKEHVTNSESSNTVEKLVIIILIILVVLGLLYLIFKKDEDETEKKNDNNKNDDKKVNTNNNYNKNVDKKKK